MNNLTCSSRQECPVCGGTLTAYPVLNRAATRPFGNSEIPSHRPAHRSVLQLSSVKWYEQGGCPHRSALVDCHSGGFAWIQQEGRTKVPMGFQTMRFVSQSREAGHKRHPGPRVEYYYTDLHTKLPRASNQIWVTLLRWWWQLQS